MRIVLALLFLLHSPAALQKAADAKVIGTVLDPNGHPVEGSKVYAITDGSTPPGANQAVTTDDKGNFVLDAYPGRVLLFAYKESDYYHDIVFGFDTPSGYSGPKDFVDIRPGQTVNGVVVHLPPQSALLRLNVLDADTNAPIQPVKYEMCRQDHLGDVVYCNLGVAGVSDYQQMVPTVPISIKITAPDYMEWRYRDAKTGSPYLSLKATKNRTLVVNLRPIKKKKRSRQKIKEKRDANENDPAVAVFWPGSIR